MDKQLLPCKEIQLLLGENQKRAQIFSLYPLYLQSRKVANNYRIEIKENCSFMIKEKKQINEYKIVLNFA